MICFFFHSFFALIYFVCTARDMCLCKRFNFRFSSFFCLVFVCVCALFFVSALYFIPSTHHCVTMINYSWKSVYHSVSVYLFFNVVVLVVDNAFVTTAAVIVIFLQFDLTCVRVKERVFIQPSEYVQYACVCVLFSLCTCYLIHHSIGVLSLAT